MQWSVPPAYIKQMILHLHTTFLNQKSANLGILHHCCNAAGFRVWHYLVSVWVPVPVLALLGDLPNFKEIASSRLTTTFPDLYSLSGRTSYRKNSWSLEAARFRFRLFQSLWNLTGTSAAAQPRCLSNFRMMRSLWHPFSRLRDFTRFDDKTSYRLMNRCPDLGLRDWQYFNILFFKGSLCDWTSNMDK